MNNDDEQRIGLAIRAALEALPPTTEVDGRTMARWLKTEFPDQPLEVLVEHVERHCRSLGRACR